MCRRFTRNGRQYVNISNWIERPPEASKKFLSGSYKYHITVDKTGYYLILANVVYENLVYNEETEEISCEGVQ